MGGGILAEAIACDAISSNQVDRVVLQTSGGARLDSGDIRFPRGNAMLPMTEAELHEKFSDCARGWNGGAALMEQLARLEHLPELGRLGGGTVG
jgi:hypothetical protein